VGNPVTQFEILGGDVRATAAFYTAWLGWNLHWPASERATATFGPFRDGSRGRIARDQLQSGELAQRLCVQIDPAPGQSPLSALGSTLERVERAGGRVTQDPARIGERFVAAFRDPEHNEIGLSCPTGDMRPVEPRHPIAFFEVIARELERLTAFYPAVFGWSAAPAQDGFSAVSTQSPLGPSGGLTQARSAPGYEPCVCFYVAVEDIEASHRRALALGARELMPVTRVPPSDRIAMVYDPTGHVVGLMQSGAQPANEEMR
jgi:predicted enzyme related to lactoylglutathione lyase